MNLFAWSETLSPSARNVRSNVSTVSDTISRLRNRHVAKLLSAIEGCGLAQVVIDAIKREFTYFANDVEAELFGTEGNERDEETRFNR